MNFRPPSSAPTFYAAAPVYHRPSGVLTPDQTRIYQVVLGRLNLGPRELSALDGAWGPSTATALRAYQTARRLPVTGQFDPATVAALDVEVRDQEAGGHNIHAAAETAAMYNLNNAHTMVATRPAATRPVATGTHPKVGLITSTTGPVTVPESVSKMIPPASVATLQTMTAPQVQSFVTSLAEKVQAGWVPAADSTDPATGKPATSVEVTAVPVVGPNGAVTAGLATTPVANGWWGTLTDNEKAAYGVGGGLAALITAAILWRVASGGGNSDRYDRDGRRR